MQENASAPLRLKKFLTRSYRDGYMQNRVRSGIAYQIQAMRKKLGITQVQMAEKLGKPQSVISRLEDEQYGRVSIQTLLDVASALDVALLVQFVSYPDFLNRTKDMSEKALQPDTIMESFHKEENSSPNISWFPWNSTVRQGVIHARRSIATPSAAVVQSGIEIASRRVF